jgi:segregation and condensation protein A
VNIEDIPIVLIFDQYMEYINEAQRLDLDLASEFILMASELMLIKSKMLLPRNEEIEEDPRKQLADALIKYQQAKAAALVLSPMYVAYSGRFVKDTDEISVDKTFVEDQDVEQLCLAARRILDYNAIAEKAKSKEPFTPMISKPIVPVEIKMEEILVHLDENRRSTLESLLMNSVSLPDMIAIFIGVLELIKTKRINIVENDYSQGDSMNMVFEKNENFVPEEEIAKEADANE